MKVTIHPKRNQNRFLLQGKNRCFHILGGPGGFKGHDGRRSQTDALEWQEVDDDHDDGEGRLREFPEEKYTAFQISL